MRISDWSSDVCSSDLKGARLADDIAAAGQLLEGSEGGLSLLRQAARRLERIADEHEKLGEALAAIDRAVIEAAEAEDRLAEAGEALACDRARLEEAEAGRGEMRALARERKRGGEGKRGGVRVDRGGRRKSKKKKK